MDYTLDEVYEYILERADKKGSDFFQLPYIIQVFQTQTYDFIDERLPLLEANQQITQDLQEIMLTKSFVPVQDPNNVYKVNVSLPEGYYHLSRVLPFFSGGVASRRPKLIRHGNYEGMRADPHNAPTPEYPLIVQYSNYVNIDSGYLEKPIKVNLTWIDEPVFAKENEPDKKIVNMRPGAIEAIIQKCILELVSSKGDPRTQSEMIKEKEIRKIN